MNQNYITTTPINKSFKEIELEDHSFVITENCTTLLSPLQQTNPPEVSVFQAKAHVSPVCRKWVSMLGDVLLNRLSNLSVDNIHKLKYMKFIVGLKVLEWTLNTCAEMLTNIARVSQTI